jgi:hypothetical protein
LERCWRNLERQSAGQQGRRGRSGAGINDA